MRWQLLSRRILQPGNRQLSGISGQLNQPPALTMAGGFLLRLNVKSDKKTSPNHTIAQRRYSADTGSGSPANNSSDSWRAARPRFAHACCQ